MGFKGGIFSNIRVPSGNSPETSKLKDILGELASEVQIGRVTDIILNMDYPEIDKYGGPNSIGSIFFELNNFINNGKGIAKPFFPQMSSYPLVNEMVILFQLPSNNIGKNTTSKIYYYLNMISLWNHPHHNAYPNPVTSNTTQQSQQRDYQQTTGGNVRRVTDGSTEINLNSPINTSQQTFIERPNIHPLLPFAGDVIHQGRWGNSIRFGSTVQNGNPDGLNLNNWSDVGTNGDPLTIIRNGQSSNASSEGWEHITEDINFDSGSIYLTSAQSIQLDPSNQEYRSYKEPPTTINEFIEPQVITNSNRIVMNAKTDSILLSAQKSIFLGTNSSINFYTREFIVDTPSIKLGDKDATESVIKGDKFLDDLKSVLEELSNLCSVLSGLQQVTVDSMGGIPTFAPALFGNVDIATGNVKRIIDNRIIPTIDAKDGYKSKVSKTL